MYTKLLKHECRANLRYLIPLYIILLFTTLTVMGISHISFFNDHFPFVTNMFYLGYVLSLILLAAFTICLVIYRFYKNFMTGEGYLMFTLPVSTHELILSKFTTGMLSTIVTFSLIIASVLLVVNTTSYEVSLDSSIESNSLSYLVEYFGIANIIYIVVLMICAVAMQILFYYLCISIGQMITQNKILGSLIAYIALGTIMQVVSLIALVIIGLFVKNPNDILSYLHILLPIALIGTLIAIAVLYLGIHYILKKKLNLE